MKHITKERIIVCLEQLVDDLDMAQCRMEIMEEILEEMCMALEVLESDIQETTSYLRCLAAMGRDVMRPESTPAEYEPNELETESELTPTQQS